MEVSFEEWLGLLPDATKNQLSEEELLQKYNKEGQLAGIVESYDPYSDYKNILDDITIITKKGNRYNLGAIHSLEFSEADCERDKDIYRIYLWLQTVINGNQLNIWRELTRTYKIPLEEFLAASVREDMYKDWLDRFEVPDYDSKYFFPESPASYFHMLTDGEFSAYDLFRLCDKYLGGMLEPLNFFPESLLTARGYIAYELLQKRDHDRNTKYSVILQKELRLIKGN